jgi:hypothetical protein
MDTYRLSYALSIHPMSGPSDWPFDRDVDPIESPIPKPRPVGQKSSGEEALMRWSQMKVLKSLERATMYVVKIVVKKAIMLEAVAKPENPNTKKYPKRVRKPKPKPKPTTVSYNIFFFYFFYSLAFRNNHKLIYN